MRGVEMSGSNSIDMQSWQIQQVCVVEAQSVRRVTAAGADKSLFGQDERDDDGPTTGNPVKERAAGC